MDTENRDIGSPVRQTLRLSVLNGFQAHISGVKLEITKEKANALLAILAMHAPKRCPRTQLRSILWSDSDELAAQNSLRNALFVLRGLLEQHGHDGLQANRSEVWLEPDSFTTDLAEAEAQLAVGEVPAALFPDQGFPAGLLAGLRGTDLLEEQFATYKAAARRRVVDLVLAGPAAQKAPQRIAGLTLLAALEPTNEAHCRDLIQALAEAGRKADALAVYQKLWTDLENEYGEEPSLETQSVIVALKQADETAIRSHEGKPVIVLQPPNTGLSEAEAELLANLTDLALSVLARFREWRVIDGRFRPDLAALIQQSNGMVSILSVTLSGMEVPRQRGFAILTEAASGQVLWSEALNLRPGLPGIDLEAAARRLATAMNLHLSGPLRPLVSLQAAGQGLHYERWIEAQHLMRQFTPQSWRQAEGALDAILKDNPGFVRALASRASIETMRQIAFPGTASTPELHRKALTWANEATLADPMDSRAQLALAWACAMSRQFERAEIAFELAFQHNENDPWTITSALVGFAFCNRIARAEMLTLHLLGLGLSLSPVHWSYVAAAKFLAGDDAACVEMSERADECSCDVPAWHAAALANLRRSAEAKAVAARFREIVCENWVLPGVPKDTEITAWLLGCFPIRSRTQWTRLRKGLALAGLQVPGQI